MAALSGLTISRKKRLGEPGPSPTLAPVAGGGSRRSTAIDAAGLGGRSDIARQTRRPGETQSALDRMRTSRSSAFNLFRPQKKKRVI
jgi:hypothetical protein